MTFLAAVIALSSVHRTTEIMANPDEDTKQWTMLSDRPPIHPLVCRLAQGRRAPVRRILSGSFALVLFDHSRAETDGCDQDGSGIAIPRTRTTSSRARRAMDERSPATRT